MAKEETVNLQYTTYLPGLNVANNTSSPQPTNVVNSTSPISPGLSNTHNQACIPYISNIFSLKGVVDFDVDHNSKNMVSRSEEYGKVPKLTSSFSKSIGSCISGNNEISSNVSVSYSCKSSINRVQSINHMVRSNSVLFQNRATPDIPNPCLHVYLRHQQHYKCQICRHEFSKEGDLFTHMRLHEGRPPYQCEDCGYAAKQMVQVKRHARHHKFRFQFKCRFCTYSSKRKWAITQHCLLIHSDLSKALN